MKAKELIKVLKAVDPDSEVCCQIGESMDGAYRDRCAKTEIIRGECLLFLRISQAVVNSDDDDAPWVDLVLEQHNHSEDDLHYNAAEFDRRFVKKEDES